MVYWFQYYDQGQSNIVSWFPEHTGTLQSAAEHATSLGSGSLGVPHVRLKKLQPDWGRQQRHPLPQLVGGVQVAVAKPFHFQRLVVS